MPSPPVVTSCPDVPALQMVLSDQLLPPEQRALEGHLASCPHCQDVLNTLISDADLLAELTALRRGYGAESSLKGIHVTGFSVGPLLAEGEQGFAYRAFELSSGRPAVIKVLRGAGKETQWRFSRESEVLRRLRHPGIPALLAVGNANTASGTRPFIATEFVDGLPITDYANEHGLGVRSRIELFLRLCAVIQFAHGRGVIHRDLKPAHILVTIERILKIVDFGIAKDTERASGRTSARTGTGCLLGTLGYMSVEALRGEQNKITGASDVYSLGVILYELIIKKHPHELKNLPLPDAIRLLCTESELNVPAHLDEMYPGISHVLRRAMSKPIAKRYKSVSELTSDLTHVLEGRLPNRKIAARPVRKTRLWRLPAWLWLILGGMAGGIVLDRIVLLVVHSAALERFITWFFLF